MKTNIIPANERVIVLLNVSTPFAAIPVTAESDKEKLAEAIQTAIEQELDAEDCYIEPYHCDCMFWFETQLEVVAKIDGEKKYPSINITVVPTY